MASKDAGSSKLRVELRQRCVAFFHREQRPQGISPTDETPHRNGSVNVFDPVADHLVRVGGLNRELACLSKAISG